MEKTAIELRQEEVAQYQANIQLYTTISAGLPTEWPENLVQYRGAKNKHEVIAQVENLDDVQLLSDLWAKDDAEAAIRAETVELRKSMAILQALQSAGE
jgi:hypothetical protein